MVKVDMYACMQDWTTFVTRTSCKLGSASQWRCAIRPSDPSRCRAGEDLVGGFRLLTSFSSLRDSILVKSNWLGGGELFEDQFSIGTNAGNMHLFHFQSRSINASRLVRNPLDSDNGHCYRRNMRKLFAYLFIFCYSTNIPLRYCILIPPTQSFLLS